MLFERLNLWIDPVQRPGPEAMAVDEWLLEHADAPVLRVYEWLGEWGSVGYFGKLAAAKSSFPGVGWVRRWTGGGTVDHRADWTYTVIAPAGEALAGMRGAESYRMVHAALVQALRNEGIDARLSAGDGETGSAACFLNPVNHDVIDGAGRKIAGAGQRRTKSGLLHQGSVALSCDEGSSKQRATFLAKALSSQWSPCEFQPPDEAIARTVLERYALEGWTNRR